ncbi:Pyridine nucleotide-disulfide oxidoreductase, partial [human gut metagenome]
MIERLIDQVKTFETSIHLNETVLDIEKNDELFTLTTSNGKHISRAILIAMGGGAFKPRSLDLDNVEQFENIHYHVSNI